MLGLIETGLFLVPVAIYAIWRFSAAEGGPSPRILAAGAAAVIVLAVTLTWFIRDNRMEPGTVYVPPRLEDGRLVPGHAVPK